LEIDHLCRVAVCRLKVTRFTRRAGQDAERLGAAVDVRAANLSRDSDRGEIVEDNRLDAQIGL